MTIDELIAALEKADGPSRELDAEISAMFLDTQPAHPLPDGTIWIEGCGSESSRTIHSRNYTRSLDAALTLVPEGCDFGFEVEHVFGGPCVYARCEPGGWIAPVAEHRRLVTIQRATQAAASKMIAIAICIAALKARRNA